MRHEILNETGKEIVYQDVPGFLSAGSPPVFNMQITRTIGPPFPPPPFPPPPPPTTNQIVIDKLHNVGGFGYFDQNLNGKLPDIWWFPQITTSVSKCYYKNVDR